MTRGWQIEELMNSNPRIPPVVNQIEVHPFNTQTGIRETCAKHDIRIEAYAPLARAMRMKHPQIVSFAKKYSCTPAQIFVRYALSLRSDSSPGCAPLTWEMTVQMGPAARRDHAAQVLQP